MPEYLAPGVYIEEIERGPRPIEGVATSTAAFLGATERGPQTPTFISSYNEYLRHFGDVFGENGDASYMPYSVKAFFDNGGRRCFIARIAGAGSSTAQAEFGPVTVTATGPGAAYNRVEVQVLPGTTKRGRFPDDQDDGDLGVSASIGFRLRVEYRQDQQSRVGPIRQDDLRPAPTIIEDFDDLSLDPNSESYYAKRVNDQNSALVNLDVAAGTTIEDIIDGEGFPAKPLEGGSDGGEPALADFLGQVSIDGGDPALPEDPNEWTGLAALDLDQYREVAIVHAPAASTLVAKAIVSHCEQNRFRFAVIDAAANQAAIAGIVPRNEIADTQYGAYYYPWITISDPLSGGRRNVPPGGAVCGIYALTDNTRGVYKAPANEIVAGAIDLEYDVSTGAQEVLNPRGVNALRRFPGRGIRVWGARTLSSDPLWKYVNVRRLMIFLEASIFNSTQFAVFEPNNERLWDRVNQTVTLFLRDQWREGALLGAKEEEAFSVAIGRQTMTEDDILNGRLIVEVGVAPVRPAEFVVFRVFQKTQEARA